MRKVKVDLPELLAAYQMSFDEIEHFLDLETGRVVMVTDDASSAAEQFAEEVDIDDGDDPRARLQQWLKDEGSWCEEELVWDALMVEQHFGERFIRVSAQESRDGYRDMADFAEAVGSKHLQDMLYVALNGKGAFRRFKDVLGGYPDEREQWFKFSEEKAKQRVLDWLESEEIEVVQ
jgi:hypothetical protein